MSNTRKGNGKKPFRKERNSKSSQTAAVSSSALASAASTLLRDAATFNFVEPMGYPLSIGTESMSKHHNIPGIITMSLAPSIGRCDRQNSAPNIAATNVFSDVRRANSGRVEYEDWDLMFYYISMGNVYAFIQYCIRLYGCLSLASTGNRYLPSALIESQRVDYRNLRDNMANFRFWLNHFITRVSQFAVPSTLPYIAEQVNLYKDVFCESTSIRDQLYMYVPHGFYIYEVVDEGPRLKCMAMADYYSAEGKLNFDGIVNYGETLLDAINQDQDWKIMSGDTAKAFGESLVKLSLIDELVALVPTVDVLALNQFMNATVVPVDGDSLIIKQEVDPDISEGYMYHVPKYVYMPTVSDAAEFDFLSSNRLLSLRAVDPSPESVIVATRLMHTMAIDATQENLTIDGGTALAVNCYMWNYNTQGVLIDSQVLSIESMGASQSTSEIGHNWERIQLHSQFEFAPRITMYMMSNDSMYDCFRIGPVDNFRVMTPVELRKLNDAAIMATFNSRPIALG